MTFNQINYFLTIAKHLNFTQAASELFVAQSTLSRSMAALEAEIGVKLLQRDFHNDYFDSGRGAYVLRNGKNYGGNWYSSPSGTSGS